MPKRMLRDWTNSKKMSQINESQEVLFTRLIMKVDDFGRFHADPFQVRSLLYPRKADVTAEAVRENLQRLEKVKLIRLYQVEDEEYLEILDFGQRLRSFKSLFPEPYENLHLNDDNPPQVADNSRTNADNMRTDDSNPPQVAAKNGGEEEEKRREEEEKKKRKENAPKMAPPSKGFNISDFKPFEKSILRFLEYRKKIKKPIHDESMEEMVKKLIKLSKDDPDIAEKIVQQTIESSWSNLFALKITESHDRTKTNRRAAPKVNDGADFGTL
jgi:hypothetical protein